MQFFWYFAYGSNMDPERLISDRLAPEGAVCKVRILGKLEGWELVFDKPSAYFLGAAAANIKPQSGSCVLGTLNSVCAKGLDVLDRYENVATKQYERASVRVVRPDTGECVDAITYVAYQNLDPNLKPRIGYLGHLLAGRDILPKVYVEKLQAIDVCDEPV